MQTDPGQGAASFPSATLVIRSAAGAHTATPRAGVVIVGREPPVQVRIDDPRISRAHVRIEPRPGGWLALDTSRNGIFVDGMRRTSATIHDGLIMRLGAPDGIALTFELSEFAAEDDETTTATGPRPDLDDASWVGDQTDPGVARAGAAVARRRQELDVTQRALARDKIINAGTLIAFEKGRSWPRQQTLARLEHALGWTPGTITRIRHGGPSPAAEDDTVAVLAPGVATPLMTQAVDIALHTLTAAIEALPDPTEPGFGPRAATVLADLRSLEQVAAGAARSTQGAPEVVLALRTVRKRYDELMLRAATAPEPTLGQRLYAARRRANLTVEEAATDAGVAPDVIARAEAEGPIEEAAGAAIEMLIDMLVGD